MFGITAGLLIPMVFGSSLCLKGKEGSIVETFQMCEPTFLMVVPMILESLIKYSRLNAKKAMNQAQCLRKLVGNKLEVVVCGGAFLEDEVINTFEQIGVIVLNGYGITECSPVVSCNKKRKFKRGTIGVSGAHPYCEVKIEDGEICVKGTIVTKGYYKDMESTKTIFDNGWLKTGDLGYIDEEGFLVITGRKKNLIILQDGNNIVPEEIEKHFMKYSIVKNVMIDSIKIKENEVLAAYIYSEERGLTKEKLESELEKVKDEINRSLPRYMQIQKVILEEKPFETTALGKVKRYMKQ